MVYRLEELKRSELNEGTAITCDQASLFFFVAGKKGTPDRRLERRDKLTLNRKTLLLMKTKSHCWLRTALQPLQSVFIILWKYSNKRRTAAAVAYVAGGVSRASALVLVAKPQTRVDWWNW